MYRLLIADDEQIECRALEHKIQSMLPDITILPSVYDGYSLLQCVREQKPDIAIVDINMPGLSGLEAIEILQMKHIHLKIIINSSYSDFSFTQKALRLGATDYLLKPGSKEALVNAIQKACRELDEENSRSSREEKNEELFGNLYRVVSEKWILSLIYDEEDRKSFQLLCGKIPQLKDGGYLTVWHSSLSEKADILSEMQELCSCVGAVHRDLYYLFLPAITDEPDKIREMLSYVCGKFSESSTPLSVGCSRYLNDISQYPDGIREAQAALHSLKHPGIAFFHYGKKTETAALFQGLAPRIVELLAMDQEENCAKLLHDVFLSGSSQAFYSDPDYLRTQAALFVVELVWQVDEGMKKNGAQTFQRPIQWKTLGQAERPHEIEEWLDECIHDCHARMHTSAQKENLYVQKALIFIHENYSKDISLEDVAGQLDISPFYLSRLFTQSKDFSFIEILTDIRIRAAIRLMKEGAASNREICERIGYTSITYFYRVFKKTTGMTVGEMRQYL